MLIQTIICISGCLMETKLASLSRRYQAELKKHLNHGRRAGPQSADRLGREALDMGLETLDLARIHEQALVSLMAPLRPRGTNDGMIKRAHTFLTKALARIEKTHQVAMEANIRLTQLNQTLGQRSKELATANRDLKKEVALRHRVEQALKKSEQHQSHLLEQSHHMQEQLRHLSHRILCVQEEERRKISIELHDEIAQVLTGINLHLSTLKKEATVGTKNLKRKITHTQRLVEKSLNSVHQFAGQLRPPALDDLGLIPALHSYTKDVAQQTGLDIRITSFTRDKIEQLDNDKRTVLYRVAQEALTNIVKHARANQVNVNLKKRRGTICMEVIDNGKSFRVQDVLPVGKKKHLGLVGMRERVEMIGGRFMVDSEPDKGTTIRAEISLTNES